MNDTDNCLKVPPQSYGALEAGTFANYLHSVNLQLPHRASVLESISATASADSVHVHLTSVRRRRVPEITMPVRHAVLAVSLTIAVALGAPFSAYGQVLAVATLEGSFTQRVNSSTWQPVALAFGTTALDFKTASDKERIVITYTASCLAAGFTVNVRANVDGVIASPGAANGVSLCLVPATGGSTYPASRTFSAVVPTKGAHKISIEVRGAGAAISIGDSALIVQR